MLFQVLGVFFAPEIQGYWSEADTQIVKKARKCRGYMAIVELCGFNDWLLAKLEEKDCKEIVVIQPEGSAFQIVA